MHEEFVEDLPRRQSYLAFVFGSLGVRYSFLLPLAALVSFVLVLILVTRGKGSWVSTALFLIIPMPIFVGIMGVVDGMIAMFQVIAISDVAPKPSELAQGIGMALFSALAGICLTVPAYAAAAVGSFLRALAGDSSPADKVVEATIVPPRA